MLYNKPRKNKKDRNYMKFKRVLLKLSGESLQGDDFLFGKDAVSSIASEIKNLQGTGVQLAIVVGGGNIMRGKNLAGHGIRATTADQMGMLATVMNGLYLREALAVYGIDSRVMSSVEINKFVEPFIYLKALRHMEKNRVVILVAGTGSPFSTTDTAAALKALELDCDVVIKATQVDGVYDKDPYKYNEAKKYDVLSYDEAIEKRLGVMDSAAFIMCNDGDVPIMVCSIKEKGSLRNVIEGIPGVGTLVNKTGKRD